MATLAKLLLLAASIAWLFPGAPSRASEAVHGEEPAADSVEEVRTPLQRAFEPPSDLAVLFPRIKAKLKNLPPFLRDTSLDLNVRSYYFYDDDDINEAKKEAWTLGGSLSYQSGWYKDALALGGTLYTSQKLYGPKDRDGTLLLEPGQNGYTVFGQSYLLFRYASHEASIFRRQYDLPYLNKQFTRMTPNTFEGYTVARTFSEEGEIKHGYFVGHFTRMKERNSDRFVPMSRVAGVADSDKGTTSTGILFSPAKGLSLGTLDHFTWDVFNILYATIDYTRPLTDSIGMRLIGHFTDQRSVGDELLDGSPFDAQSFAGNLAASWQGLVLQTAFSITSNEARIRSPYGSRPSPLSIMIRNFDRAGEEAWLVGASLDFKYLGLDGLSAFTNFARGYGARDETTGLPLRDKDEIDVTVDYRLKAGALRNFWFRIRAAHVYERVSGGDSRTQVRVILNYDVPAL